MRRPTGGRPTAKNQPLRIRRTLARIHPCPARDVEDAVPYDFWQVRSRRRARRPRRPGRSASDTHQSRANPIAPCRARCPHRAAQNQPNRLPHIGAHVPIPQACASQPALQQRSAIANSPKNARKSVCSAGPPRASAPTKGAVQPCNQKLKYGVPRYVSGRSRPKLVQPRISIMRDGSFGKTY